MKTPSGEPMPDWWWFLGPPPPRSAAKDIGHTSVSSTHKDTSKERPCMVCGQPYAEHTPEERAGGCKR